MRGIPVTVLALVSLLALTAVLAAAEGKPAEKAPKLDGKELFKANCKACHGPEAAAGEITPMSLIGEQWERFFDKQLAETHKDAAAPGVEGKTLLEVLTPEAIKELRAWCVDHAADSEHPMTCG